MKQRAIEIERLSRFFGKLRAIDIGPLVIREGLLFALVGAEGAGKTTLLRLLSGVLRPSEGSCRVAGYDLIRESESVRASVGYLPEKQGFYEDMTVKEYLDLFGVLYGVEQPERYRRIEALIKMFDLIQVGEVYIEELSEEQRRKVGLARVLIHDPKLLLLDEPLKGLDASAAKELLRYIDILKRGAGKSIVITSDRLDDLYGVADLAGLLLEGSLVSQGSMTDIESRMKGEHKYSIELVSIEARFLSIVQQALGAEGWGVERGSEQPNTINYITSAPHETNPRVVARLYEEGASIISIKEIERSLADLYYYKTEAEVK